MSLGIRWIEFECSRELSNTGFHISRSALRNTQVHAIRRGAIQRDSRGECLHGLGRFARIQCANAFSLEFLRFLQLLRSLPERLRPLEFFLAIRRFPASDQRLTQSVSGACVIRFAF